MVIIYEDRYCHNTLHYFSCMQCKGGKRLGKPQKRVRCHRHCSPVEALYICIVLCGLLLYCNLHPPPRALTALSHD